MACNKEKPIRSYEEFVKRYYPKTWREKLNPPPQKIIVIIPRPGV